jgi:hypothetical protein
MLRGAVVAIAALAVAAPAAAAVPREGVLVPGRTLGGVALGATHAEIKADWGTRYGTCRNCARLTWYFNPKPFEPQGVGVEFRRGRAVALFTTWSPPGWRTNRDLEMGEPAWRITTVYGALNRVECGRYYALTMRSRRATTIFYVYKEKLWGFGLSDPDVPVCR